MARLPDYKVRTFTCGDEDTMQASKIPVKNQLNEAGRAARRDNSDTRDLLNEREKTHGNFKNNAYYSQKFKAMYRSSFGYQEHSDTEREAIDMICLKLARIMSVTKMHRDDYEDICGYAQLALDFSDDSK